MWILVWDIVLVFYWIFGTFLTAIKHRLCDLVRTLTTSTLPPITSQSQNLKVRPWLIQLQHCNSSRVVWEAAEGKMLPETAQLQNWDIWSGLVIAGLVVDPVYYSWTHCIPVWAPCPPHRDWASLAEQLAPVAPCRADAECFCWSSLWARSGALCSISFHVFGKYQFHYLYFQDL